MAKCKLCKKDIPNGTEFCDNCLDKGSVKSNESYLDSLLNSVKNTESNAESINIKEQASSVDGSKNKPKSASDSFKAGGGKKFDDFDQVDFDQFSFDEDLSDFEYDNIISDEDLFGDKISNYFTNDEEPIKQEINKNELDEIAVTKEATIEEQAEDSFVNKDAVNAEEKDIFDTLKEQSNSQWNDDDFMKDLSSRLSNEEQNNGTVTDTITNNVDDSNVNEEELQSYHDDDNYDADLHELLNGLDKLQGMEPVDPLPDEEGQTPEEDIVSDNSDPSDMTESSEMDDLNNTFFKSEEEDDFLSLLNQISSDDPVADDVKAIGDLMNGVPEQPKNTGSRTDVGDVFSDALKVVSNLNDPNINEDEILGKLEAQEENKKKKAKKKKTPKKTKKASTEELDGEGLEEKPKKSLFQRFFANVKDENEVKKTEEMDGLLLDPGTTLELFEVEPAKKEKKGKASKAKKGKEDKNQGKDGSAEEEPNDKKNKTKKKKEKKPKQKKTKETLQVIEELDEDVGRINRLGASIVFLFFGLLALLLYVGSNTVNYTIAIKHATNYFDKQKYTQAYYEVYGVDIKDEDIQLYEKIKTVMFVNKELNSYNNYYALKEYPQALDSLLKGLKRYNKYIEFASLIGIKTDMDYVREQILAELEKVFDLSEQDAMKMIEIDNMKEYSLKVYDIVLENKDNLQSKGLIKNDSNN
jgi:hypothetical protein